MPLADFAAITGVQLRMLSKMSDLYDVPFSENRIKSIVAALLGALVPAKFGWGAGLMVASAVKSFPVVGTVLGVGTVGTFAGASTYAIGKVFVRHFESGGTFLNFDSKKAEAYLNEQYEKGAEVVKGKKSSKQAPDAGGAEPAAA